MSNGKRKSHVEFMVQEIGVHARHYLFHVFIAFEPVFVQNWIELSKLGKYSTVALESFALHNWILSSS